MLIAFTNFRTLNLQFTLNEMKSTGHMNFENKSKWQVEITSSKT